MIWVAQKAWESQVSSLSLKRNKTPLHSSRVREPNSQNHVLKKESQRHALFSFCSTITVTTTCTNVQLTQTHTHMLSGHKSKSGSLEVLHFDSLLFLILSSSTHISSSLHSQPLIYMHSFTPSLTLSFLLTFIRSHLHPTSWPSDFLRIQVNQSESLSLPPSPPLSSEEQFKFKAQRSKRDDEEPSSNHVKSERRNLPFTDLI